MNHRTTLLITSLLSVLLFSLHWADEISRGMEPGTLPAAGGIAIQVVWLSGALLIRERAVGLVILTLASLMGTGVPLLHMSGAGLVGKSISVNSSGAFFWVWTNIALGSVSAIALFLSIAGLWSRWRSRRSLSS